LGQTQLLKCSALPRSKDKPVPFKTFQLDLHQPQSRFGLRPIVLILLLFDSVMLRIDPRFRVFNGSRKQK
jgi:hypothetical protein